MQRADIIRQEIEDLERLLQGNFLQHMVMLFIGREQALYKNACSVTTMFTCWQSR